jgi:hypothetical protein
MKRAQQPHHVVILGRRRRRAAAQPVEEIGVVAFEQRLVAIELTHIKSGEVIFGKPAQNKIALTSPAVPGPEQEALAADIDRGRHRVLSAVSRRGYSDRDRHCHPNDTRVKSDLRPRLWSGDRGRKRVLDYTHWYPVAGLDRLDPVTHVLMSRACWLQRRGCPDLVRFSPGKGNFNGESVAEYAKTGNPKLNRTAVPCALASSTRSLPR